MVYAINGGHVNTAGKCLFLKHSHFWANGILQPLLSAPLTWLGCSTCRPWSFLSKKPEPLFPQRKLGKEHVTHRRTSVPVSAGLEWMETRGPWNQLASQFLMTVGLSDQLNQHCFPVLLNKLEFSTGKEPPSRASCISSSRQTLRLRWFICFHLIKTWKIFPWLQTDCLLWGKTILSFNKVSW